MAHKFLSKLAPALKDDSGNDTSSLDGYAQWAASTRGSPDEYRVFEDLLHRGFTPGVDFEFQADRLGGLSHVGDAKIQFFLPIAKVILRVQGIRWATEAAKEHVNDEIQKLVWIGRGWFVADLLADEIQQNVHRVVSLALAFQNTPKADAVLRG